MIPYMQNGPQFVVAFYAALRAGAAVVPVNPVLVAAKARPLRRGPGGEGRRRGAGAVRKEFAAVSGGGLESVVVAAYAGCLEEETDLAVPDVVRAPREEVGGAEGGVSWPEALGAGRAPLPEGRTGGAHRCGPWSR